MDNAVFRSSVSAYLKRTRTTSQALSLSAHLSRNYVNNILNGHANPSTIGAALVFEAMRAHPDGIACQTPNISQSTGTRGSIVSNARVSAEINDYVVRTGTKFETLSLAAGCHIDAALDIAKRRYKRTNSNTLTALRATMRNNPSGIPMNQTPTDHVPTGPIKQAKPLGFWHRFRLAWHAAKALQEAN